MSSEMPGRIKTSCGFTLIEALVVVVIIALLASLAVAITGALRARAQADEIMTDMRVIMTAIQAFYDEKGAYPDEGKSLAPQLKEVLAAAERLTSLDKSVFDGTSTSEFKDRYDNDIKYFRHRGPGGTPVLRSPGPDGKAETSDDNIWSDGRKH